MFWFGLGQEALGLLRGPQCVDTFWGGHTRTFAGLFISVAIAGLLGLVVPRFLIPVRTHRVFWQKAYSTRSPSGAVEILLVQM